MWGNLVVLGLRVLGVSSFIEKLMHQRLVKRAERQEALIHTLRGQIRALEAENAQLTEMLGIASRRPTPLNRLPDDRF